MSEIKISTIARASGVSRRTVYRHFADLNHLLESLFIEYARFVCESRYDCAVTSSPTEETLEQIFWVQIEDFRTFFSKGYNADVRVLPEIATFLLDSEQIRRYRIDTWTAFLQRFQRAGVLGPEMNLGELAQWLTYQQVMFCCHPSALSGDDQTTRRLVCKFLLEAVTQRR